MVIIQSLHRSSKPCPKTGQVERPASLFDGQRQRKALGIVIGIGSELYEIERHLGIAPPSAPKRRKLLHVARIAVETAVRLALIPQEAPGREIRQRADHRIVQPGGSVLFVVDGIGFQDVRQYFPAAETVIHASIRVPPQSDWIIPTGTFSVSHSFRPKI